MLSPPCTIAAPISAAVDLGSNSFRLLVGHVNAECIVPVAKALTTVKLAQNITATGSLAPIAMERGWQALAEFKKVLSSHKVTAIRACGTQALRRAVNRDEFVFKANQILGHEIEVISGQEEALLTLDGVRATFKERLSSMVIIDIGGGSVECIVVSDAEAPSVYTIPLGAVSLTEIAFAAGRPPSLEEISLARRTIRKAMAPLPAKTFSAPAIIASGGTATALAALEIGMTEYDPDHVHGFSLSRIALARLLKKLFSLSPQERCALPGLDQGRGDIILAGMLILEEFFLRSCLDAILISDGGLLEGILLSAVRTKSLSVHIDLLP